MNINLYIARRNAQMKQRDVAKQLGMHEFTYCKKERGHREFTIREAKILAEILDTDLNSLFMEEVK